MPILAGSDVHNPYVYPGFSLHEELALLVESGLSPLDALRAATINPARFLGVTDSLGTIAAGKIADLVMLDADPLTDIANTKRIRAVFLNGRFLDRGALDTLVATAERAAGPRPESDLQNASIEPIAQFLITSAATDFHKYRPRDPGRFRDVRIGYVVTSSGEKQYMLCGEFLAVQEAGNTQWTPFATIKTSGYEQWTGPQAVAFCKKSSITWEEADDLSSSLQRRVNSMR